MAIQQTLLGLGGVGSFGFTLTMTPTDAVPNGDTSSQQTTWWNSQTYDETLITNIGQQSYQGFYAFTAGRTSTLTATVAGAAGWQNQRGRSITATHSIAVGDRIVFFAGKATVKLTTGQQQGAGGGASALMKYASGTGVNGFTALTIGAGGSAGKPTGTISDEVRCAAQPLTTTTSWTVSQINAPRDGGISNHNPFGTTAGTGGFGRGSHNSSQSGGAGFAGPPKEFNGTTTTSSLGGTALAFGANGVDTLSGSAGGFGGGGGDQDSNTYGAGGGGYYGGCETSGGQSGNSTNYNAYSQDTGELNNDRLAPLSYSIGSSIADNGLHGTAGSSTNNADQTKGYLQLVFT